MPSHFIIVEAVDVHGNIMAYLCLIVTAVVLSINLAPMMAGKSYYVSSLYINIRKTIIPLFNERDMH